MSNQLLEELQELIAELEFAANLLEDTDLDGALDELECQRGTIDAMLTKAGRPEPGVVGEHMGRNE